MRVLRCDWVCSWMPVWLPVLLRSFLRCSTLGMVLLQKGQRRTVLSTRAEMGDETIKGLALTVALLVELSA